MSKTVGPRDFLITYSAYDKSGKVYKEGTYRVKNKLSELDAQIKFEQFLKSKNLDFKQLVVHSCKEETFIDKMINSKIKGANTNNLFF